MIARWASCSIASGWSRRVLQIHDPRERLAVAAADAGLRLAALFRARRRPPAADGIRRILVLRIERIGDLLMSFPALHALRAGAPRAEIDLVVGSWNRSLAGLIPGISRIDTMDVPWLARGATGAGWAALIRQARGWRDAAVRPGDQPRGRHQEPHAHEPRRRALAGRLRDGRRRAAAGPRRAVRPDVAHGRQWLAPRAAPRSAMLCLDRSPRARAAWPRQLCPASKSRCRRPRRRKRTDGWTRRSPRQRGRVGGWSAFTSGPAGR